ncbi:MAG: amidohydrolase family protein, partial [Candidatus Nanopelagicaceae bacterium]
MTVFTNAKIVDVIEGRILNHDAVRVDRNGKITSVGESIRLTSSLDKGEEVIDLGGRYLFPGLISCHTHLSVVFPFSLTDPNENPAVTAYRSAQRASEALKAGITTLRSVHEQHQADLMLRAAA